MTKNNILYSSFQGEEGSPYGSSDIYGVSHITVKNKIVNLDLTKYKNLEGLKLDYFVDEDLDLSKFNRLKTFIYKS